MWVSGKKKPDWLSLAISSVYLIDTLSKQTMRSSLTGHLFNDCDENDKKLKRNIWQMKSEVIHWKNALHNSTNSQIREVKNLKQWQNSPKRMSAWNISPPLRIQTQIFGFRLSDIFHQHSESKHGFSAGAKVERNEAKKENKKAKVWLPIEFTANLHSAVGMPSYFRCEEGSKNKGFGMS